MAKELSKNHYEILLSDIEDSQRAVALSKCDDEEIFFLLAKETREISAQLGRAKARLASLSIWGDLVQFTFSILGLLVSFCLAIWPYIDFSGPSSPIVVPEVITHLSTFVVVVFAFFSFVQYRELASSLTARSEAKYIINDGARSLEEAKNILAKIKEQLSSIDEQEFKK